MFLAHTLEEQVVILTPVAFGWMSYARLVRGNVLSKREKGYMQAARAILRHLMDPQLRQGSPSLTGRE